MSLSFPFLPFFHYPSSETTDRVAGDYIDDTPPLTHELKAYRALLSTACAIHRSDFECISAKVAKALEKIKEVPKITSELREEVRLLKIGVDSQIIRAAGAIIPSYPILFRESHPFRLFGPLITRPSDLV